MVSDVRIGRMYDKEHSRTYLNIVTGEPYISYDEVKFVQGKFALWGKRMVEKVVYANYTYQSAAEFSTMTIRVPWEPCFLFRSFACSTSLLLRNCVRTSCPAFRDCGWKSFSFFAGAAFVVLFLGGAIVRVRLIHRGRGSQCEWTDQGDGMLMAKFRVSGHVGYLFREWSYFTSPPARTQRCSSAIFSCKSSSLSPLLLSSSSS